MEAKMEAKLLSQKDVDSWEAKWNQFRTFPDNLKFEEGIIFPANCKFGNNCRFGDSCKFGDVCEFGDDCRFGDLCEFGKYARFGHRCIFGVKAVFAGYFKCGRLVPYCNFGMSCYFSQESDIEERQ